ASGDDACNFHYRWYDTKRWLPILGGLAAGLAAMFALPPDVARFALPILGAALGFIHELRRTEAANLVTRDEVTDALRVLAEEGGEARREIMAINQRQRDWSRMLEEVAAERASAVQATIARLDELQTVRENKLLGVTHDLRSPLTVIAAATSYLNEYADKLPDGAAVVDDLTQAVARMKRMTQDLMQLATAQSSIMQLAPQRIDVGPLTETLRRRIRALVHGRDIRASVFGTREAPDSIQTDPLLFDRVIDNLLGNAAKYTARGSIVLEVDGIPGFLVIKISDTGRGIEPEALEKTFTPGGSDPSQRANDSYGVGLSVVVQLLGQVGGRLEVMSKPGSGTTFWVYFPVNTGRLSLVPPRENSPGIAEPYRDLLTRVVTIRKKTA
ncbi:MAG: HAMP domain-containing sensor histidine kinase, partial [Polyangiaceae bacterium]